MEELPRGRGAPSRLSFALDGIGPGGSDTFLKDGGQIEFTQSAIVLESLVNKFFANFASKGSDVDKTQATEKAP